MDVRLHKKRRELKLPSSKAVFLKSMPKSSLAFVLVQLIKMILLTLLMHVIHYEPLH